jgi:hypothetical protein
MGALLDQAKAPGLQNSKSSRFLINIAQKVMNVILKMKLNDKLFELEERKAVKIIHRTMSYKIPSILEAEPGYCQEIQNHIEKFVKTEAGKKYLYIKNEFLDKTITPKGGFEVLFEEYNRYGETYSKLTMNYADKLCNNLTKNIHELCVGMKKSAQRIMVP